MKPPAWSFSRLSAFENCPRQFYHLSVAKDVADVKGQATIWGEEVHKHFENRLRDGVALPLDLEAHESFMQFLDRLPGTGLVEQKIALNTRMEPCEFFGAGVWYRGVIDYGKVNGKYARVLDHKTGKHHTKFGQLKLFAAHTLIAYPEVEEVRAEYYWTQTLSTNGITVTRDQLPTVWAEFTPALRQYAEAFKTDTWQPRQSGLCNGWCPVTDCEFWREKRKKY